MFSTQRLNHAGQFAVLLALCGVGIILGTIAVLGIASLTLQIPFMELQSAIMDIKNVELLRVLQVVGTFFYLFIPALLFAALVGSKPFRATGFNSMMSGKQMFFVVLIMFTALLVSGALSELNEIIPLPKQTAAYFKSLEDQYNEQVLALSNIKSFSDYVLSLLILGLLPAIFEEMFFRGCMQQIMIGWTRSAFAGILITSIIFSAIHMSYYGFLPRLFLGMLLGYIFYFSKNLWLNITAHFLNNAFAVTEMYVLSRSGKLNADSMDDHFPMLYGALAFIFIIVLMFFFKRESEVVISMKSIQQNSDDYGGMV